MPGATTAALSSYPEEFSTLAERFEHLRIEYFLSLVREMFERPDYLLPLAAGQRQFRRDNYQMASAALLEDLFFDALGMYVRERRPDVWLSRRTGREVWDYGVNGLLLSHKETLKGGFAVWWTAGDSSTTRETLVAPQGPGAEGPTSENAAERDDAGPDGTMTKVGKETFTASVPIVVVYSGLSTYSLQWEVASGGSSVGGGSSRRKGKFVGTLGTHAIQGKRRGKQALVLASQIGAKRLRIEKVWRPGEWSNEETPIAMWSSLSGAGVNGG